MSAVVIILLCAVVASLWAYAMRLRSIQWRALAVLGLDGDLVGVCKFRMGDIDALRAKLTERGREIVRLEKELESRPKFFPHGMIESLERQLSASQAREREAVERAEKAEEVLMRAARCEQHGADLTRLLEDPECARVWIQEGYDGAYALVAELNTALAAARKALEALKPWLRHHPDCAALRPNDPDHPEEGWTTDESLCTCGLSAALAPEQKGDKP